MSSCHFKGHGLVYPDLSSHLICGVVTEVFNSLMLPKSPFSAFSELDSAARSQLTRVYLLGLKALESLSFRTLVGQDAKSIYGLE